MDSFLSVNDPCIARVPQSLACSNFVWPALDTCDLSSYLEIHRRVVSSRVPNFVGCRLHVPSGLDIGVWRQRLGVPVLFLFLLTGTTIYLLLLRIMSIDSSSRTLGPFDANSLNTIINISPQYGYQEGFH